MLIFVSKGGGVGGGGGGGGGGGELEWSFSVLLAWVVSV